MPVDEQALDAARRALYATAPEQFLAARDELVAGTADADLAAAVGKLRKPTQPAWIVNAHVAAEPGTVDELAGLGAALAKAQAELDTTTLRELTVQRRTVVAELTRRALTTAGRADAGATLRDAVRGTFDAAVADPEIAARLGALQRAESWSGFGTVEPAALSVVGDDPTPEPDEPEPDPAEEQAALDTAEQALAAAESAEQELTTKLRRLTTRLTTLQHDIAAVREDLDAARTDTASARRDRRAAQTALDRAGRAGR